MFPKSDVGYVATFVGRKVLLAMVGDEGGFVSPPGKADQAAVDTDTAQAKQASFKAVPPGGGGSDNAVSRTSESVAQPEAVASTSMAQILTQW